MRYPAPFVAGQAPVADIGVGVNMTRPGTVRTVAQLPDGFLEKFRGASTLKAKKNPDVGLPYRDDLGDDFPFADGFPTAQLPPVLVDVKPPASDYAMWTPFRVLAENATNGAQIKLMTRLDGNDLVWTWLTFISPTWTLEGWVFDADGNALFDSTGIDVTDQMFMGVDQTLTTEVSASGASWKLDGVEIFATTAVPTDAPNQFLFTNFGFASQTSLVLNAVELLPQ